MTNNTSLCVKSILMCAISAITLSSCDSDMVDSASNGTAKTSIEKKVSEVTAERSFAKILSVAAEKNASLRAFLKQEAQKQYDKDFDVFYPYVKDKEVEHGKTLRDILVENSSEEEIRVIENSAPLLTIMIPDLSSFKGFSVNKWDTANDQIATTYATDNDQSVFFAEGDSLLSLPAGSFPSFPFLVVKNNERMKVVGTTSTRAGETKLQYDFVDPAFDGTKEPQTRASYYDEKNTEPAPEVKPYLKKDQIDNRCIEAYNLSKNNKHQIDREYIYYNLSSSNPFNGEFDPLVKEKLYMFKVDASVYPKIVDDPIEKDPRLMTPKDRDSKDNTTKKLDYSKWLPSKDQIIKDCWTDGSFEFVFEIIKGGSDKVESKQIPVKPANLFYINKFHVRYQHHTAFRHTNWKYITSADELEGKWYDISDQNIYITDGWNLTNDPLTYNIKIYEQDKGAKQTISESYTSSYVSKLDASLGYGDTVKFNLGFSNQETTQKTKTVTYQIQDEDDYLGGTTLNFKDPIIKSDEMANSKGYEMYSLNTGSVNMVIAPEVTRK